MADSGIVRSDIEKALQRLREDIDRQMIEHLSAYAQTTLLKAYESSTYSHSRTNNLKDSYVWAVYRNGILVNSGFLTKSPEAQRPVVKTGTGGKRVYGREEAQAMLDSYQPLNARGYEVIFGAALYYGEYLEYGTARNRQYVVMSSIFNKAITDFSQLGRAEIIENMYTY